LLKKETKMTVPTLFDYLIGFDRDLFYSRGKPDASPYPPFDAYKDGENTILEFALAGYSKDNIEVMVENSTLKVSAKKEKKTQTENYTYKGIALRSFEKKFALSEYSVVESAEYKDGILRIVIGTLVPEEKKPKIIKIQ
jgi:molecular chaperone IbpA